MARGEGLQSGGRCRWRCRRLKHPGRAAWRVEAAGRIGIGRLLLCLLISSRAPWQAPLRRPVPILPTDKAARQTPPSSRMTAAIGGLKNPSSTRSASVDVRDSPSALTFISSNPVDRFYFFHGMMCYWQIHIGSVVVTEVE